MTEGGLSDLDEQQLYELYMAQVMAAPAPEPRVGEAWQCAVPEQLDAAAAAALLEAYARERHDELVWAPPQGMAEEELDDRVARALDATRKLLGRSCVALDRVLALLHACDYDVARTVSEAVARPQAVRFVVRDGWSTQERQLFERGLEHLGKNWRLLQELVGTRTLEEVYTFYYTTKRARDEQGGFRESEHALFGNHRLNLLRSLYALRSAPALRRVRLRLADPLDLFYEQYGGLADSDEEEDGAELSALLADAGSSPPARRSRRPAAAEPPAPASTAPAAAAAASPHAGAA